MLYPLGTAVNTIYQNCHADGVNANSSTTQSYESKRLRNYLSKQRKIIISSVPYLK